MEPEVTPTETRGGVISGRVMAVLIASTIGALVALSCTWWLVSHP
jgi:hypothetical protein